MILLHLIIFACGVAAHSAYVRFVAALRLRRREIKRWDNTNRDERAFAE